MGQVSITMTNARKDLNREGLLLLTVLEGPYSQALGSIVPWLLRRGAAHAMVVKKQKEMPVTGLPASLLPHPWHLHLG